MKIKKRIMAESKRPPRRRGSIASYVGVVIALWASVTPAIAYARAPELDMARWREVKERDGIKVWSREVAGSSIREFKAATTVGAALERAWTVINDIGHYAEFLPYTVEAKLLPAEAVRTPTVTARFLSKSPPRPTTPGAGITCSHHTGNTPRAAA